MLSLYAGNNLVATSAKAPFSLEWNTLSVNDGSYEVRAVTDREVEYSKRFDPLLLFKTPCCIFMVKSGSPHRPGWYTLDRGWIFLSDQDGSLVAILRDHPMAPNSNWQTPAIPVKAHSCLVEYT